MIHKQDILIHLIAMNNNKIASISKAIDAIRESKNTDTKSSAGDKYETGREMMQLELNKYESQLAIQQKQRTELEKIKPTLLHQKVGYGSLIITNYGTYLIAVGLGAVQIHNETIFVISLASPIGKVLKDKEKGEKFLFQGKEFNIQDII